MNDIHAPGAARRAALLLAATAIFGATALLPSTLLAVPLLPDLFPYADDEIGSMRDGAVDRLTQPGRELYRFSLAIGNRGDGPFELWETTADDVQTVWQTVFDSDGLTRENWLVGEFEDPQPLFGHLFLPSLARYNLREVLLDGSAGEIVATQDKTSFGVADWVSFDTSLPDAPQSRVYTSVNDPVVGISIGWADFYRRQLHGQWIDVTGLPSGEYWLEAVIDPLNYLQELNRFNTTVGVLVELDLLGVLPGDYNSNGEVDAPDYITWRDSFGSTLELAADGNGNGVVDAADYVLWRDNFGDTAGAAAPEPSSVTLQFAAIFFLLLGHRPAWRLAQTR